VHQYLPPQHGAWAFLGLPVLLAVTVTPWSWLIVVLTLAWVIAYPWSYAALGLLRARRPARFRTPFLVFSMSLAPLVVTLLVARP
jgi:phosphatidylglycerophosphate synthase